MKEDFEMFVTSLETAAASGNESETQVVERPSWDAVVRAVQSLDGGARDSVVLNGPEPAYMGIAGGHDGQYVVAGRRGDGKPFILTVGEHRGTWVLVAVGGQENEYADNEVVGIETALAAAHSFFESGACDPRFQWREKAARMTT
jgi:Immunity protein Imm1